MGILDFIKNKQQKTETTALIKKDEDSIEEFITKKKKIRTIVDFVENALISNGGNYEDIYQKLLALAEFATHAKEYGVQCNLRGVNETLRDFFTYQTDIAFFPVKDKPYAAFYAKKDGSNFYNYRGVTVLQDEQAKKPVMYYGRRHKNAETHRKDCIFCFGDDVVILRDESKANYNEIPLWGDGTHAEFSFDENNHITRVKYRYMTEARLGFWSKEQVCEYDDKSGQYRFLPMQIPERTYKDPQPSKKSMEICARIIVNGQDDNPQEDKDILGK